MTNEPTSADSGSGSGADVGPGSGEPVDSDAMWKPGFVGSSATKSSIAAPSSRRIVDDEIATFARRRRRRDRRFVAFATVVALTAVAVAATVRATRLGAPDGEFVAGSDGSIAAASARGDAPDRPDAIEPVEPLVAEPFAGADRRRLPAELGRLWTTDLDDVSAPRRMRLEVLDDGTVVGVFGDLSVDVGTPSSTVVALDGDDGAERWRVSLDGPASALTVLVGSGDAVVLEREDDGVRSLIALSAETGEARWVRRPQDPGVHTVLDGTRLIARESFTLDPPLSFIDAASGEEVGRLAGRLFATDSVGTWYVRDGTGVVRLELADGWSTPEPLAELWVGDDVPVGVVDERLVAVVDGRLEMLDDDGAPEQAVVVGKIAVSAGLDDDANFSQLLPIGEDALVLVAAQSAFGAELVDDGGVAIRWQAIGTPIASRPTDRGRALVMATEGGGAQRVVDASTGREIAVVELVPGAIETLQLVANGVVVKQSATIGSERVGVDLDGNRLWSLVGEGPLAVGDGVVVTHTVREVGVTVTAYGDPSV